MTVNFTEFDGYVGFQIGERGSEIYEQTRKRCESCVYSIGLEITRSSKEKPKEVNDCYKILIELPESVSREGAKELVEKFPEGDYAGKIGDCQNDADSCDLNPTIVVYGNGAAREEYLARFQEWVKIECPKASVRVREGCAPYEIIDWESGEVGGTPKQRKRLASMLGITSEVFDVETEEW
ncbi:MAG: hypothetical protein ISS36_03415 [Candidatus Aenigmarchaeota archaeon]|nr:hypothetical protein [Candidatus Aenigmarchaeota archaeon]